MIDTKEFKSVLKKWQKRLSLSHWIISVHSATEIDLDEGTWANVSWDSDRETADIWLFQSLEWRELETWLVHELVHIVLDGDGAFEGHSVHHERKINRIVKALLNKKYDLNTETRRGE